MHEHAAAAQFDACALLSAICRVESPGDMARVRALIEDALAGDRAREVIEGLLYWFRGYFLAYCRLAGVAAGFELDRLAGAAIDTAEAV